MATAVDVARYFLGKVDRDAGDAPTHLWVQKMVYYAQAWSLVFLGVSMFPDEIQAWKHGPVVTTLWSRLSVFGNSCIPEEFDFEDQAGEVSLDEERVLRMVWDVYGELSALKLRKLTHQEMPWLKARRGLPEDARSQTPIELEDMKDYYADFVELSDGNEPSGISRVAVFDTKDNMTGGMLPLVKATGELNWVSANNLREYFEAKGLNRRRIKIKTQRPPAELC